MVDLDTLGRNMRRLLWSAGGLWVIGLRWPAYVFVGFAFVLATCMVALSLAGTVRELSSPTDPERLEI